MRLPWVSRSVMDGLLRANDALNMAATQLISERDWLRSELHNALDHTRRLERSEAGLTEKPRDPKPPIATPERLTGIVARFGTPIMQADMGQRVRRAYADKLAEGKTPAVAEAEIEAFLLQGLNEE